MFEMNTRGMMELMIVNFVLIFGLALIVSFGMVN